MKLNGEQKEKLVNALCSAFDAGELSDLVSFKLNETLAVFANTNTLRSAARDLVNWCERRGRTGELIVGARTMNPGNPDFKEFAEGYTLPTAAQKTAATPERLVLRHSHFLNVEQWIGQMTLCTRAVCRVETASGEGLGTGFLIGPRHVITNAHVVFEPVGPEAIARPVRPDVQFNFGHRFAVDGRTMVHGPVFRLTAGDDWLAAASPDTDLDFAVLRTAEVISGPERQPLRPVRTAFEADEAMLMIQHPKGSPLKIAWGSLLPPTQPDRVTYSVNSLEGSSGSPVFNSDLNVVALHCAGDVPGNLGVPFASILFKIGNVLEGEIPWLAGGGA